jgi:PhnB protein
MPAKVKPVPEGYHTVTPYLTVKGAAKLIEFMKRAFGAEERFRFPGPGGTVAHAELKIGDSMIMLGDAGPQSPEMTGQLYIYIEDCDRYYRQALAAGATSVREPADQFYGDRNCSVKDSFGNIWSVGTHVEDVSSEEMQRRMQEMTKKAS